MLATITVIVVYKKMFSVLGFFFKGAYWNMQGWNDNIWDLLLNILARTMVIDEISVTKFWKLQNLGNSIHLSYFSICLKISFIKLPNKTKIHVPSTITIVFKYLNVSTRKNPHLVQNPRTHPITFSFCLSGHGPRFHF